MNVLKEQYKNIEEQLNMKIAEKNAFIEAAKNGNNPDIKNNEFTDPGDTFTMDQKNSIINEIANLTNLLNDCVVVDVKNTDSITFGTTFKCVIDFDGEDEVVEYTLVETKEGLKGSYISVDSPLGKSVMGKKQDERFEYQVGQNKINGKIIEVINYREKLIEFTDMLKKTKLLKKINDLKEKKKSLNVTNKSKAVQMAMLEMEIKKLELLIGEDINSIKLEKPIQKIK